MADEFMDEQGNAVGLLGDAFSDALAIRDGRAEECRSQLR